MINNSVPPSRARAFSPSSTLRVDWFRLLQELNAQGYSLYAIAHLTGITKASLVAYKQGTQPTYNTGAHLIKFWSEASNKDPASVPMISPFSFMA